MGRVGDLKCELYQPCSCELCKPLILKISEQLQSPVKLST